MESAVHCIRAGDAVVTIEMPDRSGFYAVAVVVRGLPRVDRMVRIDEVVQSCAGVALTQFTRCGYVAYKLQKDADANTIARGVAAQVLALFTS